MLIDSRLEFSDGQALTATAVSNNVVDLGLDRDIGPGVPMFVIITVQVAADDANANETYEAALQTDDNVSFSSASELASVTIPRGAAIGDVFVIAVPPTNERYLRLNYTLGGTTPSVTLNASLSNQLPKAWRAYADAIDAP